ncbi:hypothetical protein HON36_01540 [Candidatus Parcubacteria bacterium]|jgi:hypothetical protein|nr:hypothetical protein [Candidatus Parcubacteria bacterium]MBT7228134.1 hypothetical protein [Candidatus Parcubacteria bacterium]
MLDKNCEQFRRDVGIIKESIDKLTGLVSSVDPRKLEYILRERNRAERLLNTLFFEFNMTEFANLQMIIDPAIDKSAAMLRARDCDYTDKSVFTAFLGIPKGVPLKRLPKNLEIGTLEIKHDVELKSLPDDIKIGVLAINNGNGLIDQAQRLLERDQIKEIIVK